MLSFMFAFPTYHHRVTDYKPFSVQTGSNQPKFLTQQSQPSVFYSVAYYNGKRLRKALSHYDTCFCFGIEKLG